MTTSMKHVLAVFLAVIFSGAIAHAQVVSAKVERSDTGETIKPAPIAEKAATWNELRSENFVLRGAVRAEVAREFIQDLELFRSGFLDVLGTAPETVSETASLSIFVIDNDIDAGRILGSHHAAGFYQKDLSGPVLVLNAGAGFKTGDQARLLAMRSVADHILSGQGGNIYPPWLREGLIEYFSVSQILENTMQIGLQNSRHDYPLRDGRWIGMRDTVQPFHATHLERAFASDDEFDWHGQFSAQSWLAVHYIMSDAKLGASLPGYLARVSSGQHPRRAFKSAFGLSEKRFQKRMKSHLKHSQFGGRTITVADASIAGTVVRMTPAKKDYYFGQALMSAIFDGDSLAFAESHMAQMAADGDLTGEILASRAMIAAQKGDPTAADVHLAAALKAAPNNVMVQRAAADIAFERFNQSRDADFLLRVQDHAQAILAKLPTDPQASYYYAAACAALECPVEKAAKAAYVGANPALEYAGANLNLIPALIAAGETDKALSIAQIATIWGNSPEAREGGLRAHKDIGMAMKTTK